LYRDRERRICHLQVDQGGIKVKKWRVIIYLTDDGKSNPDVTMPEPLSQDGVKALVENQLTGALAGVDIAAVCVDEVPL
jgi:hypothetical protein